MNNKKAAPEEGGNPYERKTADPVDLERRRFIRLLIGGAIAATVGSVGIAAWALPRMKKKPQETPKERYEKIMQSLTEKEEKLQIIIDMIEGPLLQELLGIVKEDHSLKTLIAEVIETITLSRQSPLRNRYTNYKIALETMWR